MYLRYFFKDSNTTKPNHPFKMESEFTPSLPDNENLIEYMSLVYNDFNTHDNNNQKSLHRIEFLGRGNGLTKGSTK